MQLKNNAYNIIFYIFNFFLIYYCWLFILVFLFHYQWFKNGHLLEFSKIYLYLS